MHGVTTTLFPSNVIDQGERKMARFHLNLNLRQFAAPSAARDVIAQRMLRALQRDDAAPEPDAPGGPGWFDSSWELVHGLEVREGLPGEAQLHEWLEVWLRTDAAAPKKAKAAPAGDALDAFGIDGLELV
jgi:hypothetical protein